MNQLFQALAALLLTGCAGAITSAPKVGDANGPTRVLQQGGVVSFQTSRAGAVLTTGISAEATRLWDLLPAVYREIGLEATQADIRNRILRFDGRVQKLNGTRLSEFLDCGRGVAGPNADTHDVTLRVVAQVAPVGSTSEARAQVEATARNRGTSGSPPSCISTGVLESRIFEILRAAAGSV